MDSNWSRNCYAGIPVCNGNGCQVYFYSLIFTKKSSIYAGLGQGAIYSTLHRKEVVDDKKQDKKRVERPKGYF